MSRLLTPTRVEAAFWVLLCGGLAVSVGVETDWGRQTRWPVSDLAPAPTDFASPTLTEPFRLPPPDQFLETTLRPVFVVTRRPAPIPPPPEPPKPSMRRDQFVLTGTTIVPDGKMAFLLERASNKVRVVGEGNEINGVKVKEVSADRVVLTQYDDTEVLVLKPTKPSNRPITAVAQPNAQTMRQPLSAPASGAPALSPAAMP